MRHADIEEGQIVARYEMDTLSEAELVAFEEHMVDCAECQEAVELEHAFRYGLRALAPAELTSPAVVESSGNGMAVSRTTWWLLTAAAIGGLALLGVLGLQVHELRDANLRHLLEAANWQRLYSSQRATIERQQTMLRGPAKGMASPALLFSLSRARSGETTPAGTPVDQLRLTSDPRVVVFSVDAGEARFTSYRITLARASGEILWTADHLAPTGGAAPPVAVPSQSLQAGNDVLTVEGCDANGGCVTAGKYAFQVSVH